MTPPLPPPADPFVLSLMALRRTTESVVLQIDALLAGLVPPPASGEGETRAEGTRDASSVARGSRVPDEPEGEKGKGSLGIFMRGRNVVPPQETPPTPPQEQPKEANDASQ